MDELEFYRDDSGNPCVRGDDERVARFVESDLQGSVEVTESLLALLAGTAPAEFNGNAHSVTITPMLATIECHFDDGPDRRLERQELATVVRAWLEFIR
ncbi:MAG: hypothetical protein K0U93_00660 [Gammaproteobacteria bacterium]|nr:hypothetical protein [Gammaproteobacteria bacterium]